MAVSSPTRNGFVRRPDRTRRLVLCALAAFAVIVGGALPASGQPRPVSPGDGHPTAGQRPGARSSLASLTKQKGMTFEECRDTVLKGTDFPLGPKSPSDSSLEMLITHSDVLTKSAREFRRQIKAYKAAGIGPWLPKEKTTFTAGYCGKQVRMKRWVTLTTNTDETYVVPGISYFEIWRDVSTQPNFFKDWACTRESGFVYQGMLPADKTLTTDQVIAQLREQQVPVIMVWTNESPLGEYDNVIIRLGKVYAELIIVPGLTN